jgi:hypothetical protein
MTSKFIAAGASDRMRWLVESVELTSLDGTNMNTIIDFLNGWKSKNISADVYGF